MTIWKKTARNLLVGFLVIAASWMVWGPFVAEAAWVATDDFESYASPPVAINGGAGGSSWNGNWSSTGSGNSVVNTVAFTGSQSLDIDHASNGDAAHRNLTGVTSGIIQFAIRRSNTTGGANITVRLRSGTTDGVDVVMNSDGNLNLVGGTTVSCATWSTNTWYQLHVSIDVTGGGTYKCRLDGDAAWSSTVAGINSISSVDDFHVADNGGGGGFIDDIKAGSEPASAVVASAPSDFTLWFGQSF